MHPYTWPPFIHVITSLEQTLKQVCLLFCKKQPACLAEELLTEVLFILSAYDSTATRSQVYSTYIGENMICSEHDCSSQSVTTSSSSVLVT